MLIYVLDDNMHKIDLLRKHTYVQYTERFRDIGVFTIHAQLVKENLYLLDRNRDFFVLFDNKIFGKIEVVKQSDDFEYEQTIEITGRLAKYILTKRVINGTIKYKGNTANYIKTLIEREFVQSDNAKRHINIKVEFEDESAVISTSSNIEKTQTGGYVWEEIKTYLDQDKLGLMIYPVVRSKHVVDGKDTNISEWRAVISAGRDKRQIKGRSDPLIFSKSLSNISRVDYEKNVSDYCGTAYIAGEGEGAARKWYEKSRAGEESKSGWNRSELWIDARDIQSEKEGSTEENPDIMTDEEYEELINQRVEEKFTEHEKSENYSSTITRDKKRLIYESNAFLGDWVTVKDETMGFVIDAQVVEAVVSEQNSQRIIDINVEYGRAKKDINDAVKTLVQKVDNQESTIKYLVNNQGKGTGGGGSTGGNGATIQVGTVSTLSPGSPAYVHNVGTINDAVFNFGIPRGQDGQRGEQGIQGLQGVPGQRGEQGEQGVPGVDGKDGKDGLSAGFGTIDASVDDSVGIPSVEVETMGTDQALDIYFKFHNLKGQPGGSGTGGGCDLSGLFEQLNDIQHMLFGFESLVDDCGNAICDENGVMLNVADEPLQPGKMWGIDENGNPGWLDIPQGGGARMLGNCSDIVAENTSEGVALKWADPDNIVFNKEVLAQWEGTKVVKKVDTEPVSVDDGLLIADSKVKDAYKSEPLVDASVVDGESYNYAFFPYTTDGALTESDFNRVNIICEMQKYDPVFANNSWEEISKAAQSGEAAKIWKVGDIKAFNRSSPSNANNIITVNARIIGFDCENVNGVANAPCITFLSTSTVASNAATKGLSRDVTDDFNNVENKMKDRIYLGGSFIRATKKPYLVRANGGIKYVTSLVHAISITELGLESAGDGVQYEFFRKGGSQGLGINPTSTSFYTYYTRTPTNPATTTATAASYRCVKSDLSVASYSVSLASTSSHYVPLLFTL